MKMYVEMSEAEYNEFEAFRDERKVNDVLYDLLSEACEMFLRLFDNIKIEKGQSSVSIDGGVAVQVISAKHKFEKFLQCMQKARTKRNETGEIDSWYYFQEFEALSRICKG